MSPSSEAKATNRGVIATGLHHSCFLFLPLPSLQKLGHSLWGGAEWCPEGLGGRSLLVLDVSVCFCECSLKEPEMFVLHLPQGRPRPARFSAGAGSRRCHGDTSRCLTPASRPFTPSLLRRAPVSNASPPAPRYNLPRVTASVSSPQPISC